MAGGHLLRHWSRQQHAIALSSGEAELYALNRGAQEGMGLVQMSADLGLKMGLCLLTDATAAKGIVQRSGSGRLKHVEVQELWLQEVIANQRARIVNIPPEQNVADLMAKHWNTSTFWLFSKLGLRKTVTSDI